MGGEKVIWTLLDKGVGLGGDGVEFGGECYSKSPNVINLWSLKITCIARVKRVKTKLSAF